MKKILCMDFDGVIHSYKSGWKGPCEIPDPPVPGAFDWLIGAVASNKFEIYIYSSRSKEAGAIVAMMSWFARWGLPDEVLKQFQFPTQKPAAHMTIDDRAFCFAGVWPALDWVENFKPWNKK